MSNPYSSVLGSQSLDQELRYPVGEDATTAAYSMDPLAVEPASGAIVVSGIGDCKQTRQLKRDGSLQLVTFLRETGLKEPPDDVRAAARRLLARQSSSPACAHAGSQLARVSTGVGAVLRLAGCCALPVCMWRQVASSSRAIQKLDPVSSSDASVSIGQAAANREQQKQNWITEIRHQKRNSLKNSASDLAGTNPK